MSLSIVRMIDPDGTLHYDCGHDIAVRVALHPRNGTKKCPVELLYQGRSVLSTDSNLRELRDIESLLKHAGTRQKDIDWHEILTAVASELPEKARAPWTPVGQPLSVYTIKRREYLWYPWLLKAEPCSIEGDPNVGKTSVLIKILAHLTSGTAFPTLCVDHLEEDFEPATVILFTNEDNPHTTLHPRLVLNGGNPDRVIFMEGKRDPDTGHVLPMTLTDVEEMEQILTAHHPALMCFDPLQSYLGADVDMNRASDTRPVLDGVATLCAAYGCTPCYIRHNGKTQRTKAMHAALGSIDITAHMRSVLTLYKDPDETLRRILAHTKHNGRPAPSMQLNLCGVPFDALTDEGTLTIEEVRVDWDGKSDLTSEDLNARESAHGNDTQESNRALDEARAFLRDMLKDGAIAVKDLITAAKHAGVKRRTLERAKDKEGVKAQRVPCEDVPSNKWPWEWGYPPREDNPA
jgi:hypothetical protein